jgi:hypothetical protein
MLVVAREAPLAVPVRILMLLACVPLLGPPGVCLCAAGDHAPPAPRSVKPAQPPAGPHAGCRHHHAQPPSDPPAPATPAPAGDDHHPGCPAAVVTGTDEVPGTDPTPDLFAFPPAATLDLPAPATPAARASASSTPRPRPSGLPLFLHHCALVC